MPDPHVSIGQVKRDISELVNRVAFGGERVILTSRGKPKAVLVNMEDYERLLESTGGQAINRLQAWMAASDQLAATILAHNDNQLLDANSVLEAAKVDLEERHDYLRGD